MNGCSGISATSKTSATANQRGKPPRFGQCSGVADFPSPVPQGQRKGKNGGNNGRENFRYSAPYTWATGADPRRGARPLDPRGAAYLSRAGDRTLLTRAGVAAAVLDVLRCRNRRAAGGRTASVTCRRWTKLNIAKHHPRQRSVGIGSTNPCYPRRVDRGGRQAFAPRKLGRGGRNLCRLEAVDRVASRA